MQAAQGHVCSLDQPFWVLARVSEGNSLRTKLPWIRSGVTAVGACASGVRAEAVARRSAARLAAEQGNLDSAIAKKQAASRDDIRAAE